MEFWRRVQSRLDEAELEKVVIRALELAAGIFAGREAAERAREYK